MIAYYMHGPLSYHNNEEVHFSVKTIENLEPSQHFCSGEREIKLPFCSSKVAKAFFLMAKGGGQSVAHSLKCRLYRGFRKDS